MAFDEYQFLRYFIPGSLYVIYTTALIIPFLDPSVINFFKGDTSALLGVVGGAFGASLAIGYIIYTFYDTFGYTKRLFKDPEKRKMLGYLNDNIQDWKEPLDASKKEFLDMLWIKLSENNSGERFFATVRGMWSHFNARVVCYKYVPIFAGSSVPLIWLFSTIVIKNPVFSFDLRNLAVIVPIVLICIVSAIFKNGAKRPLDEGTTLEYFYYLSLIEKRKDDFDTLITQLGLKKKAKTKKNNQKG